jgi:multiple sugar transport system permease protein
MAAGALLARRGVRPGSAAGRGRVLGWLGPLGPALLLLLLFFAGPVLWCLWAALTDIALTGTSASSPRFVGLENFSRLLSDPVFRQSVLITVQFVLGSAVIGQNCLGLLLALLLRGRSGLVRGVVGGSVVAAWVIPEIVAGFVWYAFLSDDGTLNTLLDRLGLGTPSWLFSLPVASVVLANIWRGTAFSMLVYSAALSEVPSDLVDAAAVDGAGPLARLWYVTLPLIKRSVLTNLMLITLQTLAVFTLVFVMTGGGPGTKSQTMPLFMYQEAFRFFQLGYGTAVALVLLLLGAMFSLVYVRGLRSEV